jgi:succinyl-CoA synthetase alpha subunit
MAILVNEHTRVLVQGLTGNQGEFHAKKMLEYGTQVVAGTRPGKGGTTAAGIPVFDTVAEAVMQTGANAACIFVPAPYAKDAALEAIASKLDPVVIITERIPVHDSIQIMVAAKQAGVRVIGPNGPGVTSAGTCKIGIMPNHLFKRGRVGLVSRSGTLTYEIVAGLTNLGLGQTTALGLGGDPVVGVSFTEAVALFNDDPDTEGIVLVGEIGGSAEEEAARYIAASVRKPVVGYIAGRTAPPGKRMGHAGAVISGGEGTAQAKTAALEAAGVRVAELPGRVPELMQALLRG